MFSRGEYSYKNDAYGAVMRHNGNEINIILVSSGVIQSAYKKVGLDEYCFINTKAKEMYKFIEQGLKYCTAKNGVAVQFHLGTSVIYQAEKAGIQYAIEKFNKEVVGVEIKSEVLNIKLNYVENGESFKDNLIPPGIPYVKLVREEIQINKNQEDDEADNVVVRSIEEIALEKEDVTWLQKKKYYIVNDDEQAEKLFTFLDNYNGIISYDTETTGLKINCFGKINSQYSRDLEEYNKNHPDDKIRADRLVGIIFCIESDVSYYFPCANRKFKNLYEGESATKSRVIDNIKSRYIIGEFRNKQSDLANYIRNTPREQLSSDVILMERVRNILTTKHLVTHGGSFEYKVGCMYEIDTHICDDTMLMHQIMYKFRSTTSNKGEPSNLKYLSKVELGIDQWELKDFFPEYKDSDGIVRQKNQGGVRKKKGSKIDFSYMDYKGTRIYAPADGDCTFQLCLKYKKDLLERHKEQEYLYQVEVLVACAIGYMEFYGHRIDESKIQDARDKTTGKLIDTEAQIREIIGYANEKEIESHKSLRHILDELEEKEKKGENTKETVQKMLAAVDKLRADIDENVDNAINIDSPAQVADLFYDELKIPLKEDKKSVAKKVIKGLSEERGEDGELKYPVVGLYANYKKLSTLLTKFFDQLPDYMYPGGYVFPSYGQISTATGRMSCSKPNAQQYCHDITSIVIPRPGCVMLDADYSQIEYRVLVALSGEKKLAELFNDPDSDYHTLMASLMYEIAYESVTSKMRKDAKSFNFGIPYGMGFGSLAILLTGINNEITREEAKKKYELYFKDQPNTRKFFDQVKEMAQVNKYTTTFWHRYRYYSFTDENGNENNARKAAALRQAGNAVIQGCLGGNTKIQTKKYGIIKIADVVNKSLLVWNGTKWTNGDILYSGKKRKCIVTFSNGQQFICSPTHKFLVKGRKDNTKFVECQNLISSSESTNPHRVVINREHVNSDYRFSDNKTIRKSILYNSVDRGLSKDQYDMMSMDTSLLKEFLRGVFGKYGYVFKNKITLTFGAKNLLNERCEDIQKALTFLGIRCTCRNYDNNRIINISTYDSNRFMKIIGYANDKIDYDNSDTQDRCITVKSVEITDEYIDMYDVCNTDEGYYVADGFITHNTAADLFKISVARNFMYIRQNNLFGKFMISNMIHDEQLMEVNVEELNIMRVLRDVGKNMQFKINGFPPLYIGAGINSSWDKAKDKLSEIHPNLLEIFSEEADNMPIRKQNGEKDIPDKVIDYYNQRILEFRKKKVLDYILNPENKGKDLHPAIGNLINLQFTYGHNKKKEGLDDKEFTKVCLSEFIKEAGITEIKAEDFEPQQIIEDVEEDKEYTDDEDELLEDEWDYGNTDFALLDESDVVYGSSLQDLIHIFGCFVSPMKKVCGIDMTILGGKRKESIIEFLSGHACNKEDKNAMEIIFLKNGNVLNKTGIYVSGIEGSEIEKRLKLA